MGRVICLKLDDELLEEIEAVARELNISRSEAIRRAIRAYTSIAKVHIAVRSFKIKVLKLRI